MCETLAKARRRRRFSGDANLLGATRQLVVNTPGSGFSGAGHASCGVLGNESDMATQTLNRRESDRVPMGVESAMPLVPVPRSESAQPPKAKSGILRKLALALLVLLFLVGVWQIGKGLYIQAKAQLAQVLVRDAWARTLAGERQVKPWQWADTWPVARLSRRRERRDRRSHRRERTHHRIRSGAPLRHRAAGRKRQQ